LNVDACIRRTVIILDLTGTRIDIASSGYCALYVAANVEYNRYRFDGKPPIAAEIHWMVVISPISADLCSIEYCSLNRKSCNYIAYDRDQI
jgi:hypothetical protein